MLAKRFSDAVPADVRERGEKYFRQGRVRVVRRSKTDYGTEVRGSHLYEVDFELTDQSLFVSCTCPYSQDYGDCKHIWASLLAADRDHFAANRSDWICLEYASAPCDDDDPPPRPAPRTKTKAAPKAKPKWEEQIAAVERAAMPAPKPGGHWQPRSSQPDKRMLYLVSVAEAQKLGRIPIELANQNIKKSGEFGAVSRISGGFDIDKLDDPADRRILSLMNGTLNGSSYFSGFLYSNTAHFQLNAAQAEAFLPALAESQRLFRRPKELGSDPLEPLKVELGEPWEFALNVAADETGTTYRITGNVVRGSESLPIQDVELIVPGVVLIGSTFQSFRDTGGHAWQDVLRRQSAIVVPASKRSVLVDRMLALPRPEKSTLPPELAFEEVRPAPQPHLVIKKVSVYGLDRLKGDLSFIYDGHEVPNDKAPRIVQADRRRVVHRDLAAEEAAEALFLRLGFRAAYLSGPAFEIMPNRVPKAVLEAAAAGWLVEGEGKLYRRAGHFELNVASGTDWFDLGGAANFDGVSVPLPRLLEALRKGDKTILLDDGSIGMVPEEWLKKYGQIAQMGTPTGDVIRFGKTQVGVLDALLASRPEVSFDKQFQKARSELKKFEGVELADPPAAFQGELRGYQREGLGWLKFLRKFGFGGCLADDMGLGKTVQVLAHLASIRKGVTLVVVPRSLIFNWKQEAARFAPKLKVLDHTGLGREKSTDAFAKHDLVLTTYGTLRRDAALFADYRFDTCVLDESQAAKNANTETAKSVKLIQADHRLALSGTPIENHLGELWTLFDFLNPGMLGRAGAFGGEAGSLRNPSPEMRELLAKALKPFILRRTKSQVAKDLPEKTEQTLFCELEPEQRKLYDELRDHYRAALLSKVDELGMKRTKIQVLAALLRLRQAACHPGLIDEKRAMESCAKFDALLPQIQEVIEEGHKVLVFSQFTSFLGLAKTRLDALGLPYEYLDGQTRDRAERVERFQNDADCKLFLVSLKAGGVGLNLTAADYVYLLDPWWNPAVEAQAIDRSHRIGQSKSVFAYRLIARNTVEEKVLELQKKKKSLADSILEGDGRLLADLRREDLEMLLS